MPLSITDFIRALREVIGLTKDIGAGVVTIRTTRRSWYHLRATKSISTLRFTNAGFKEQLKRLAEGKGTQDDLMNIHDRLRDTGIPIGSSIKGLAEYSDVLRESAGLAAVERLDDLINHNIFGKLPLRQRLRALAAGSPNSEETMLSAKTLLADIDRFNNELRDLHDFVLERSKK